MSLELTATLSSSPTVPTFIGMLTGRGGNLVGRRFIDEFASSRICCLSLCCRCRLSMKNTPKIIPKPSMVSPAMKPAVAREFELELFNSLGPEKTGVVVVFAGPVLVTRLVGDLSLAVGDGLFEGIFVVIELSISVLELVPVMVDEIAAIEPLIMCPDFLLSFCWPRFLRTAQFL